MERLGPKKELQIMITVLKVWANETFIPFLNQPSRKIENDFSSILSYGVRNSWIVNGLTQVHTPQRRLLIFRLGY